MEPLRAAVLGLLQGLTEFFPVSSSGHLVLAQELWGGYTGADFFLDVMLHVGTLAAVVLFCRREVASMWRALLGLGRRPQTPTEAAGRRLLLAVTLASIPTAAIGLLLRSTVNSWFSQLVFVGAMFLVTAAILALSPLCRGNREEASPANALLVGVAQGLALLPGLSRSGATIVTAKALGMESTAAARFAFVISIPAVLGTALVSAMDVQNLPNFNTGLIFSLACGTMAAALSGYLSLIVLSGIIRRARLNLFSFYCAAAGLFTIALGALR